MGWGLLREVSWRVLAWRAHVPLLALAVLGAAGEEPAEGREKGAAERPFEAGRELGRPGGEGSSFRARWPSACPSLRCLAPAAQLFEPKRAWLGGAGGPRRALGPDVRRKGPADLRGATGCTLDFS